MFYKAYLFALFMEKNFRSLIDEPEKKSKKCPRMQYKGTTEYDRILLLLLAWSLFQLFIKPDWSTFSSAIVRYVPINVSLPNLCNYDQC